ncbi:MAG: alpha/beta fold hydrolase [Balneolaceae bacterium]
MIAPTPHHHWHIELASRTPDLPWMLLFHGFLGCGEAMRPLAQRISSRCNPLLIDLPGHGETRSVCADPLPNGWEDEPDSGFRLESQIEDLSSMVDRLQCGPVWLYGYSMGGRLALQLACACPDLVSGLILESSTPGITDEADRRERQELDRERARAILQDLPGFLDKWEQMPLFQSEDHDGSTPSSVVSCSRSPEGLAASLLGFGTGQMPSVWESLESLQIPVLLLSGEGDSKFIGIHKKMARNIPDAMHIIVKRSGHRVHRDRPDEVASRILDFLRSSRIDSTHFRQK